MYITDLEVTVADHETRLTAAEENLEGRTFYTCLLSFKLKHIIVSKSFIQFRIYILFSELQMTDVELEARITTLEENQNGKTWENE